MGKRRIDDGRKAINALVSPDAHAAWHAYAGEQGVSVSALLQAIGEMLRDDRDAVNRNRLAQRIVGRAKQIDADGRRRGGERKKWYDD